MRAAGSSTWMIITWQGGGAPTLVIVGTLVASLMSTNAFLGETGFAYETQAGAFIAFALMAQTDFGLDDNIAILGAAAIGTAFFVIVLLSTQEPWAVGGALFVVTAMASGFGDVNPGILAGGGINDVVLAKETIEPSALYAMIGGVIGAIAGWAVKDNVLD